MKIFSRWSVRGGVLALHVGIGIWAIGFFEYSARAAERSNPQSQAQLEEEILKGKAPAQPTAEAASSSSDNTPEPEVPSLAEPQDTERFREKDLKAIEDAVKGPGSIPRNHIFVVQRQSIHKEKRHEIEPLMVGLQPSDSFRKQIQWGVGYVYHLSEDFGIEFLHLAVLTNYSTGLNQTIRNNVGLETDRIEPVFSLGSTLQWTPLHSKAATDDSVYFFEGYFVGGGGVTKFETSTAGLAMLGLGFRVSLSKWAFFKSELRDYIDFRGSANHRFNFLAGLGVLIGDGK